MSRIYVGSFWNQPLQYTANRELFEMEEEDLFDELQALPRFAMIRRLNDLIKRAKSVKVRMLKLKSQKNRRMDNFNSRLFLWLKSFKALKEGLLTNTSISKSTIPSLWPWPFG